MTDGNAVGARVNRRDTGKGAATRAAIDGALEECRAALLRMDGPEPVPARAAIAGFAACARTVPLPPERFLALFKRMAAALPWVERLSPDERAQRVTAMSTIAIEAYYAHALALSHSHRDGADAIRERTPHRMQPSTARSPST